MKLGSGLSGFAFEVVASPAFPAQRRESEAAQGERA